MCVLVRYTVNSKQLNICSVNQELGYHRETGWSAAEVKYD
jgi:hypothetical protein